jgi:hypothetical protein
MLFHADVWFPPQLQAFMPKASIKLIWSKHAIAALWNDRYGICQAPLFVHPKESRAVEVEFDGKKVIKVLYRTRYDNTRDLCIVVMPETGVVKTAWVNLVCDTHKTLDSSKYVQP